MAGDQYGATFEAVRGRVDMTSDRVEMERAASRVRDSALCALLPRYYRYRSICNIAVCRFSFPSDLVILNYKSIPIHNIANVHLRTGNAYR